MVNKNYSKDKIEIVERYRERVRAYRQKIREAESAIYKHTLLFIKKAHGLKKGQYEDVKVFYTEDYHSLNRDDDDLTFSSEDKMLEHLLKTAGKKRLLYMHFVDGFINVEEKTPRCIMYISPEGEITSYDV